MNTAINLGDLYRKIREQLRTGGIDNPGLEAAVIVCSATGKPAQAVYTRPETPIETRRAHECENRALRRLNKEPSAYVTGKREFFSRDFAVSPAVLIPRPETETVVEKALSQIPEGAKLKVLDAGTGSGCIAVTLKKERPAISATASDISPAALQTAAQNARFHGAEVRFVLADMLCRFGERSFDVVVSNPPYVAEHEFKNLPEEVKNFEPKPALTSGENGFEHTRKVVSGSARVLRKAGVCVVETGDGQAEQCAEIFTENGFSQISTAEDLSGKTRAVAGIWKR